MKAIFNITTAVVLLLSMLYVGAVDSMSNLQIVSYGAGLAGGWYIVRVMYKELRISK